MPSVLPALVSALAVSLAAADGPSECGNFANPKSMTRAWPRALIMMLAGLMSRCSMPWTCAAARA